MGNGKDTLQLDAGFEEVSLDEGFEEVSMDDSGKKKVLSKPSVAGGTPLVSEAPSIESTTARQPKQINLTALDNFIAKQKARKGQLYPEGEPMPAPRLMNGSQESANDEIKKRFGMSAIFEQPSIRENYYDKLAEEGYDRDEIKQHGDRYIESKKNLPQLAKAASTGDQQAIYKYATALSNIGDNAGAFSIYAELGKKGDNSPQLYQGLAYTLHKLGDDEQSQKAFDYANELLQKERISASGEPLPEEGITQGVPEYQRGSQYVQGGSSPQEDLAQNQQAAYMGDIADYIEGTVPGVEMMHGFNDALDKIKETPKIYADAYDKALKQYGDSDKGREQATKQALFESGLHTAAAVGGGAISYLMTMTPIGQGFIEGSKLVQQGLTPVLEGNEELTPEEATGYMMMPMTTWAEQNGAGQQAKDLAFLGDAILMGAAFHAATKPFVRGMSNAETKQAGETATKIMRGEKTSASENRNLNRFVWENKSFAQSMMNPQNTLMDSPKVSKQRQLVARFQNDVENAATPEAKEVLQQASGTAEGVLKEMLGKQAEEHTTHAANRTQNEIITQHQEVLKSDLPNIEDNQSKKKIEEEISALDKLKVAVNEEEVKLKQPSEQPTGGEVPLIEEQPLVTEKVAEVPPVAIEAVVDQPVVESTKVEPIKTSSDASKIESATPVGEQPSGTQSLGGTGSERVEPVKQGEGSTGQSAGKEKAETPGENKGDVNESEVREDIVSDTKPSPVKVGDIVAHSHKGRLKRAKVIEVTDTGIKAEYNVGKEKVTVEIPHDEANVVETKEVAEREVKEPVFEEYPAKLEEVKTKRKKVTADLVNKIGDIAGAKKVIEWDSAKNNPTIARILIDLGKTYLDEGAIRFEHFAKRMYEDLKKHGILFNRSDKAFQKDLADIYNKAKQEQFQNIKPEVALSVQRKAAALTEKKLKQAKQWTWNKFYKGFVKHIEDISGNVKEAIRNAGGEEAVMLKDISNKSNGRAALKIKELDDKIFKDLDDAGMADLGNIIQAKRTIQLDELYDKRKQPRLSHESGHTKEFYEAMLDGMEAEDQVRFDMLTAKADEYFAAMNELLKEKKKNGLVSDMAYEVLKEQSMYSPRMFLQYLDQIESGLNAGNKTSVGSNGIKKLEEGSEGLLEKDPRFLMATTVSKAYNIIAKNNAATALLEFSRNNPDNGIVTERKVIGNTLDNKVAAEVNKMEEQKGIMLSPAEVAAIKQKIIDATFDKAIEEFQLKHNKPPTPIQEALLKDSAEKGELIFEDVPTGKEIISAFENGTKKDMLMNKVEADEWVSTDPAISQALGEAVQWLTGANLLRYTATGANPLFAIANAPRDMAYIYFTTDAYSNVLPKFVAQIHKDMAAVMPDVVGRKGRYKEFMEEGGSIEFLTHQGRFDLTKPIDEGVNSVSRVLGWAGETSELLTRMALRERGIKKGTEQFVKDNNRDPDPAELKKIKIKATYDAINQLDFSQGGDWSKALNKFIPYLNAAVQGMRGTARAARKDPKLFASKAAQLAAVAGGLTVYNMMQPGYDQISDDEKARNYIIMLGGLYSTDKYGNRKYRYLKIAKSQETQFLSAMAENAVEFVATGKSRPKEMMIGLKNQTAPVPFIGQNPPMAEMIRTYQSNYDTYFDKKLWTGQEGVSPELEFIPTGDRKTPKAFKWMGEKTGLSPERMRGSLPKLVVGVEKNPFFTIPGKAFQAATEAMGMTEKDVLNQSLSDNMDGIFGGLKGKFYGETTPTFYKESEKEIIRKELDESKLRNDDIKNRIDASLSKKQPIDDAVKEFSGYVDSKYPQLSDEVIDRMITSFETGIENAKMDYWYVKLVNLSPKTRAQVFKNRYDTSTPKEKEEMLKTIQDNEHINTDEFYDYMKELGFTEEQLELSPVK